MTTDPVNPGRPVNPGQPPVNPGRPVNPGQPGFTSVPPSSRVKFVVRDQVLGQLHSMPNDTDGLLIVSPIGAGSPDDIAQMAMYINPDHAMQGSMSFLINTRPDVNTYDVLDLNNLPLDVEVSITIRSTDGSWEQNNRFRGNEGNVIGAS
jgi:hypothetical protein